VDCVFCKIIKRELPASFVYEDELCIAFLDIHPMTEGHVLIIPKVHKERFTQLDDQTAGHIFKIGHKVLRAVEKSELRSEGANLFLSDGVVAGQEVMHSHLHIAPRFKGDGQRVGFMHADPEQVSRKSLDEIALKISSHIS
jgi:histidine triad (HIT) family protein